MRRLLILVTNDDGIDAPGIRALAAAVRGRGEVVVVAPDGNRSASGHAITLTQRISVSARQVEPGIRGFAVGGTPVDAVKLALEQLLPGPPDLVLSGVNHGSNLGRDVFYSGTVSAAMEAAFMGAPAVAVSLAERGGAHMVEAAAFVAWWLDHAYRPLPRGVFYNVNLPPLGAAAPPALRVTRLGERHYLNEFQRQPPSAGRDWYVMAGMAEETREAPETDVGAIAAGFVSVTPLSIDLTAQDAQAGLATVDNLVVPADVFCMTAESPDTLSHAEYLPASTQARGRQGRR